MDATGKPEPVADEVAFWELLAILVAGSEERYAESGYDFDALPRNFVSRMMQGIVGFRMPVERIEGKFELGQERSE